MNLSIRGFPADTTEQEIRDALEKFGAKVNSVEIMLSENPDRHLAVVDIDTDRLGIDVIADRINGVVWKGKRLVAQGTLHP